MHEVTDLSRQQQQQQRGATWVQPHASSAGAALSLVVVAAGCVWYSMVPGGVGPPSLPILVALQYRDGASLWSQHSPCPREGGRVLLACSWQAPLKQCGVACRRLLQVAELEGDAAAKGKAITELESKVRP